MQSKNKSKKKVNHKKASLAKDNSSSEKEMKEESSSFKKLISRFLTNLCEKKYAEAHKNLEQAVVAKTKGKIRAAAKNVQDNKNPKNEKSVKDKKNSKNVSK